jgi:threonine synthase
MIHKDLKVHNFITPIIKLENVNTDLKTNGIFLKMESANIISHTFKDRGAKNVINEVKKNGFSTILAATCSNMGVAVAGVASKMGINSIIVISSSAPKGLINMIKSFSTKYIVIDGGFDEVDSFVGEISKQFPNIPCVNTNYNPYFFDGYFSIIDELSTQLDIDKIYNIIIPTADGTLISSMHKRYKELRSKKNIAQLKFHIAQPSGCSPIVDALLNDKELETIETSTTKVIPLSVKNPIMYGNNAIKAVKETGGMGFKVDEKDVDYFSNLLKEKEGIYSDSVGGVLMGAIDQLSTKIEKDEYILGIYTGNGLVYSAQDGDTDITPTNEAKNYIINALR